MGKRYSYVGPENILRKVTGSETRGKIPSRLDLEQWIRQRPNRESLIAVTFVVDEQGELWVADRGSEHVACSAGQPVLSAGEMFFVHTETGLELVEVTNQSTGFCPEPESWPVVAAALDRAAIPHPGRFTLEIIFRRCSSCGERNIVKDAWFVCGLCGADLPRHWNFEMTNIRYLKGDATSPQAKGVKIIAHICNDLGKWGKGFVMAISARWPEPEFAYREWHRGRGGNDFALGSVQFIQVETYIWVANMVAQHGVKGGSQTSPIRYEAVETALEKVAQKAVELNASVHMPRIGCGLAGGKWDQIEPLIVSSLCEKDVAVTVYDF